MAQVCNAMANLGHEVTFVKPTVWTPIVKTAFEYYSVAESFHIVTLKHWDALRSKLLPERIGFPLSMLLYQKKLKAFFKTYAADLIYVRSPLLLTTLIRTNVPVILELHSLPGRFRNRFVENCNRCKKVVCLTSPMRDELVSWGVNSDRVVVEGDAVDLRLFEEEVNKDHMRSKLGLPKGTAVIGYAGRLKTMGKEKGVRTLLEALSQLQNVHGLIIGGPEEEVDSYKALSKELGLQESNITFTGHLPHRQVPRALQACDILAMPFPDEPHYRNNMSPMKMFEYMASNRATVVSNLPSVRDVLDEDHAYFCTPGDSGSLAKAFTEIMSDADEANRRAANAFEKVKQHTWEKRMRRILDF